MRIDRADYLEINKLVTRLSIALILFALIQPKYPYSIPFSLILAMLVSYKNPIVERLWKRFLFLGLPKLSTEEQKLLQAIDALSKYKTRSTSWNDRRRVLFRRMPWRHQSIAIKLGFPARINDVQKCINENSKLTESVIEMVRSEYGLPLSCPPDLATEDNIRVIETLCHYARDWSSLGDVEVQPLTDYIKNSITKTLNQDALRKTNVIVPGSGLGRISHELALLPFHSVHSVEYSTLMYLFNKFVYSDSPKTYKVYPFAHSYSHHVETKDQQRSIDFTQLPEKPTNLHIHNQDFNEFTLPSHPKNLVIVTAFFLDTAENMLEYFDTIDALMNSATGTKLWINMGPLKYGTAARVEFSYEELKALLSQYGWKLIDEQDPKLLGYLTNLKGLWQGNYGVTMWTATK
ncbi:BA75_01669T0 [Komagataella pastoris]|uniref:BA75_01669T0 n=1 Tax=Komagataella pastoris TaxID=4922 RepID=A0A1B2J5X4_PICPA|nr:BA75_01669T0 [Komagataella pastoris]